MKDFYTMGIETSCDDSSVAILKNDREVLINLISSQIDIHKIFGGVVPEIASRKHLEAINPLIEKALLDTNLSYSDIDLISVTKGPGLIGFCQQIFQWLEQITCKDIFVQIICQIKT